MTYLIIKCGGSILESLPDSFFKNIVELKHEGKWKPVIVHGGGPHISTLLQELHIPTTFENGLRVTTKEALDVTEMALSGLTNKQIVRKLYKSGGMGFGLSGVDGALLKAKPIDQVNLGLVGEVTDVNHPLIENLTNQGFIPVISPISMDENGQHYNVNADTAASAIAESLHGYLCFVSDIPGILVNNEVVDFLTEQEIEKLIEEKVIKEGMIPKVLGALHALENKVKEVVIINENGLKDFCEGKKVGTRIRLSGVLNHG